MGTNPPGGPPRITSVRNPTVQFVRSLDRAAVRREHGVFVAEGVRLVAEALASGQRAEIVLYRPELLDRSERGQELLAAIPQWAAATYEVNEHVLEAAARTDTPAGIVAALRLPDAAPLSDHRADPLGLILDALADPGNAGTILRTADAFGVSWIVTTAGTVDLFSPKVVRAGMGAHFRLPLYQHLVWTEIVNALPDTALVAADSERGETLSSFTWPRRSALVIGGEAHGLSPEVDERLSSRVRIPMRPGVESLNAAVAASIAMYAALARPPATPA